MGSANVHEPLFKRILFEWYAAVLPCNYLLFIIYGVLAKHSRVQQISKSFFFQCYINNSDKHFPMFTLTECEDTRNWLIIFWLVFLHILSRQCACHSILKSRHIEVVCGWLGSWKSHQVFIHTFSFVWICFLWNN